jgi:hypothetical protein
MDLTQLYETTIYDRESGRGFSFVTIPERAYAERMWHADAADVAGMIGLQDGRSVNGAALRLGPVEAWSLPFLIDDLLDRYLDFPDEFGLYFDPLEPRRPRRGPSRFAQYVTYAPVVPFESSPLSGQALGEVVTKSGMVGGAVGAYVTGDPLVVLVAAGGLILGGAAQGVSEALRIGLRSKLLGLMGVEDPNRPSDDDPASA